MTAARWDAKADIRRRIQQINSELDSIYDAMQECKELDNVGDDQDEKNDKTYTRLITRYNTLIGCLVSLYKSYRDAEPSRVSGEAGPKMTALEGMRKKRAK